ncbi:hypothetical protein I0D00_12550 [Pseudomonas lalucatii]|uniref:Lipoprotein n=1 Tax=Pseudomonas lalucatii TaxID=1424203 RepID=A0ABS5Q2J2_9PSED|nr:hypothetical protein [Pseudomonas lalucatii]MBS7662765.1 hypothetical protein [Pseudomonas lalucatii]MBS7691147.1 hypothetical protein [Pseudomonas lalucatii]MBS7725722.1 hypothetical protein [Pseudomonas lalucatii]QVM88670.1 hypothetical protein I0D68_09750 [Pseudomonas lalucatii]
MRRFALIASLSLLGACASPLPPHDPGLAWVELYTPASDLLMADELDGKRLDDGRYFQVSPGSHELISRFLFEVPGGGSGSDMMSEPIQRTCEIRVRYADFAAGQRYRLEARSIMYNAQAWLYDDQRNVLARGRVLRCGTF